MIILKDKIKLLSLIFLIININKSFAEDYPDEFCSSKVKEISPIEKNTHAKLSTAQINFAVNALDETALILCRNIVLGTHSIYEALLIAYIGSGGSTMKNLQKMLEIPDDLTQDDIEEFYMSDYWKKTCPKYANGTSIRSKFLVANRIYMSEELKTNNKFLKRISEKFTVDNSMPGLEMRRININKWVEDTTEKNMPEFIPPNDLWSGAEAIFINGVYMKTIWKYSFDPANTKDDIFYGIKNTIAHYMVQENNYLYKYSEYLGADVLKLPYDDNDISMYVFLPTKTSDDDGIRKLINQMKTYQGIAELNDIFVDRKMDRKSVKLLLPRFVIEKKLPTEMIFNNMGAGDLVGRKRYPNLSKFTESDIYLAAFFHTTKIDVSEDGITPVDHHEVDEEPVEFYANHPFIYLIFDRYTGTIIIAGVYRTT